MTTQTPARLIGAHSMEATGCSWLRSDVFSRSTDRKLTITESAPVWTAIDSNVMVKARTGPRGLRGKTGVKGSAGARGRQGERGVQGVRGPVGPAGPKMKSAEVLALVDDQFTEIRKQLTIQLQRTGQLQAQLDRIQKNTTEACSVLDLMHPLVKKLVTEG